MPCGRCGGASTRFEVDRLRVKPTVKITGEFYLQTVEGDPNYNIHRWLEAEGAEVYPAVITVWFDYLMRMAAQEFEDHIGIDRGAYLKSKADPRGAGTAALDVWTPQARARRRSARTARINPSYAISPSPTTTAA